MRRETTKYTKDEKGEPFQCEKIVEDHDISETKRKHVVSVFHSIIWAATTIGVLYFIYLMVNCGIKGGC